MKNFANDLIKDIKECNVEIWFREGKTHYPINDGNDNETQITVRKGVADILQIALKDHNLHQTIQQLYDKSLKEQPCITRIKRGDYIRNKLEKMAIKYVGEDNILESLK